MKRLENKTALITGGAGSIGLVTAKKFIEQGARVVLVDLNEDALKNAVASLESSQASYIVADVSQSSQVENYAKIATERLGKIDIFFNNAGIEGVVKPITEYPEDVFDKVIAVNVKGVFMGCKYMLPLMRDGGSLIITSSVAGLQGSAGTSAYNTSKHAVIGVMRSVALEAAPRKIRVNSVHPSPVDNRMMRSLESGFNPDGAAAKAQMEKVIPLGRYAEPAEIGDLVLFLASDESKYITGTTQVIDGGMGA
ncbi:SDR family NAD(P)-dependent oxidoreductase [Pedobacter duraquae]|uniref:NAD(P)-dependent dehydrogenase (Short-subunit alcohol dehydrogenase family) n=1 Tax=Pedobacter duraquae TaxID=425511 RepID=A0A4V3C3D5_9SPHI|nr:SDR family NAD(P)-dependent oxidoreductase [Pedobacter duraquae]TDO21638.1 NAD(P)-dependent dehydrogenase (short-subunit alcohol dehydrogenase family) [Pedobacter duraquae]